MDSIANRIVEGMAIRNMKQIDIIEKAGINKGALSSYISGKYEPKQTNIYKIAKALNVNEAWLMGHNVPMERKPEGVIGLFTGSNTLIYGSLKEETMLQKYRLLDDKGKHTVETVMDMEYNRCKKPHQLSPSEDPHSTRPEEDTSVVPIKNKEKYIPTEEDIRSLVARNGNKLTKEQAIDIISTLFSDDDNEE